MSARIGFDVTAALAQGGGIGRYTRELIRALVATDSAHQYRLFSARLPVAPPVPNALPVAPHVVHRPAPVAEQWLYRLWYRLRLPIPVQTVTGPLDLFHSPDFVLPPVSGGIPTLLTVHDLSFVHFPDTFPAQLVAYLNRVVPWSVERATHVLADSAATRDDLQREWAVPAEKITVLTSGVNPCFQSVTDPDVLIAMRSRYDLGSAPFFLAVGTVQPRKNYPMLVRAFRGVADRLPHQLVIAGGRGWLVEGLLAEIEQQGLSDRVRLIGFVDDADLPAFYSAATAFLFPSLYEGFGLPLLEAMACGTPVISSDASCLPEIVAAPDGDAGLLVDPADEAGWTTAMLRVAGDKALRADLVRRGRDRAAT
jgi:glycosyltransferase involved in cell wall biosynthesis